MENSDLLLLSRSIPPHPLTDEQKERTEVIFRMLISLFEKAYIILYDDTMTGDARRRWLSWEDDIIDWLRKPDFRAVLPDLLEGEDDAYSSYMMALAKTEAQKLPK